MTRITYGCRVRKNSLPESPRTGLLVGCAYLLIAFASVAVTRVTGEVALFWPANALAAAVLIRLPEVRWFSVTFILLSAGIAANIVAGQGSWVLATLFSCINLSEATLMVAVFRFDQRYCGSSACRTEPT